ncbi:alpha/beta fold hydrolase [Azospirillum halopraeferens]|uniref:alpha/beta fold hydrolase n=1 Tax=Azospirillum halopraeferens TaxID=34010 RepID=UPI0004196BCF|nr:alpha/beta fold hydrolase [Azospirillum halopraeferens]
MTAPIRPHLAAALLLTAWTLPAAADVHDIGAFTFENGESIESMAVGYDAYGTLNEAGDNAILVTHGTSGGRDSYAAYIGPGRAFDTDRYYVVAVDAIGGGDSSKPSDDRGTGFPRYTQRDLVHAQHALLTGLGVNRLVSVGGASMGAFQALEWGLQYPDFVDSLLVIAGAPLSDRLYGGIVDTMVEAMQLDPAWNGGDYETNPTDGLQVAGMVFQPWLYSDAHLNGVTDDDSFAWLLRSMGRGWAESWDATDWMYRYRAAQSHDVSAGSGTVEEALGRIRARTLIVHVTSDRLFPEHHARTMDEAIPDSRVVYIESDRGHMACCQSNADLPEYAQLTDHIRDFLAEADAPATGSAD